MALEKTGSAKTATGNVRTVRLNTYRERKFECQELEKENKQLSNSIVQLQDIICAKDEELQILKMQVADQEIIKDKFEQLQGEVVKVGSKLETSFSEEIEQSETIEVITERIVRAAPSTPPPPPSPEVFIDYDPRPDVAVEAARMERKNRQNALILQNEALQLEQVTSKNRTLEEQLAKEKQRLKHELEEKELQLLKGELAALNDKLNALQVRNNEAGEDLAALKMTSQVEIDQMKQEFNGKEKDFKKIMKNSMEENDKLREHNQELMSDLSDVQELISNMSDQNSAQAVYKERIESLEKENKICKKLIETKNEKIENLEKQAEKGDGASDLAERIESLNTERGAFEEQSQKYKIAIGAQKRYIDSLNEALRLSDETRIKLKEEIAALQHEKTKTQEQVKAFIDLRAAEKTQRDATEKYKKILEARNEETDGLLEQYKQQMIRLNAELENVKKQNEAKDKLNTSFKRQTETMKQLLNQYDVDSKQKGEENKVLTDKLNRLIKINTDLLENKPTEPVEKIVVEGSPEAQAEQMKMELQNAELDRDLEKTRSLVKRLTDENKLQQNQIEKFQASFLKIDTEKMELEETVRNLKKRVDIASGTDEKKGPEETNVMNQKVHEMNQKLIKQMTQMNDALNYCQKEKDEIIAKSEKLIKVTGNMKQENERLQNLVIQLQEQLEIKLTSAEKAEASPKATETASKPKQAPKKKKNNKK